MYQHFIQDAPYTAGIPNYPRFNYIKSLFTSDLERINKYLTDSAIVANNAHVFSRLVSTFDSLYCDDIKTYMLTVYNELSGIERMYGFSSATNPNITSYDGTLYRKGVADIFLSVTEYFDYYDTPANTLVALKALSHPFSMLNYAVPDGKLRSKDNDIKSISVTMIDIGKMAYVYHNWLKNNRSTAADRNKYIPSFVFKYYLASLTPSVLDVCYFNRLNNYFFGMNNDPFYATYPIPVNDYSNLADESIAYYVKQLSESTVIYDKLMAAIPAIRARNISEALRIPDININRYNAWTILVSRIDVYLFILALATSQRNNTEITEVKNKMRFYLQQMNSDNALDINLPYQYVTKLNRLKVMLQ